MKLKLSSPTKLVLRPWTVDDLYFSLKVRNHPLLMKWFRQDEPISVEEQRQFILKDVTHYETYNGRVIEADGEPVGLCGVKNSREFTIGILPEHQGRGIAKWVMGELTSTPGVWSEVFIGNPALEFFIAKCGFKITGVKERAYYKQGVGLIDIVRIEHE